MKLISNEDGCIGKGYVLFNAKKNRNTPTFCVDTYLLKSLWAIWFEHY